MDSYPHISDHKQGADHGSVRSYTVGFLLSVGLTLVAYLTVVHHLFSGNGLIYVLIFLALVQLAVQLLFFLHVGRESQPRWNLHVLLLAFMVVFILVVGTLWIMKHLDYNMLSGLDAEKSIIQDEGIHP